MSTDELNGMIWMLTHWLLPAKATKDDAYALMDKALAEYKTGLTLRDKEWLCGHAAVARTSFRTTGC